MLNTEQLGAFNTLRERLIHPPVLTLPKKKGRFILDTDASGEQIGCCLFQEQESGPKLPIGYWSRSLNSAERNYSTTEKEFLAIVWAILQLRPYLEGQRFLIRTDHHSLRWVLNLSDAQGRLARWRLRLLEFDFEVEYSPGKEHHGADTLSRLPVEQPVSAPLDTEIPCFTVERDDDPDLESIDDFWTPNMLIRCAGNFLTPFLSLRPSTTTRMAHWAECSHLENSNSAFPHH